MNLRREGNEVTIGGVAGNRRAVPPEKISSDSPRVDVCVGNVAACRGLAPQSAGHALEKASDRRRSRQEFPDRAPRGRTAVRRSSVPLYPVVPEADKAVLQE